MKGQISVFIVLAYFFTGWSDSYGYSVGNVYEDIVEKNKDQLESVYSYVLSTIEEENIARSGGCSFVTRLKIVETVMGERKEKISLCTNFLVEKGDYFVIVKKLNDKDDTFFSPLEMLKIHSILGKKKPIPFVSVLSSRYDPDKKYILRSWWPYLVKDQAGIRSYMIDVELQGMIEHFKRILNMSMQ